ncbi:hypothetical protein O6474_24745, partial [Salmonella enterica subsp. enterica]
MRWQPTKNSAPNQVQSPFSYHRANQSPAKGTCMKLQPDPDFNALQGAWEQTSLEDSGVLN